MEESEGLLGGHDSPRGLINQTPRAKPNASVRFPGKKLLYGLLVGIAVRGALITGTLKWLFLTVPVSFVIGCACAGFLWTLEYLTVLRQSHRWFIFLLPVGGIFIGLLYFFGDDKFNKTSKGNNAIILQINTVDPRHESISIPTRMAPMVYVGTIVTHLFGGSAGREGTAIQMAASIMSTYIKLLDLVRIRLAANTIRTLIIASIAGGFGGIFGVPVAGAVFAMEVLSIGRVGYEAIIPCLIASVFSDWTTRFMLHLMKGAHSDYHPLTPSFSVQGSIKEEIDWILVGEVVVTGIFSGLAAVLFVLFVEKINEFFTFLLNATKKGKQIMWLKPIFGAACVICLNLLFPDSYLGIGVPYTEFTCADIGKGKELVTISSCFCEGGARPYSWLLKLIFTTITLGSGFKGGEVTPLFYIGAALGNACSLMFGSTRTDLFAAVGFVGVFSGATNTPLACTIMGIELFGGAHPLYLAISCFLAYLSSGFASIYYTQAVKVTSKVDSYQADIKDVKGAAEDVESGLQIFRAMHNKIKDLVKTEETELPEFDEEVDSFNFSRPGSRIFQEETYGEDSNQKMVEELHFPRRTIDKNSSISK